MKNIMRKMLLEQASFANQIMLDKVHARLLAIYSGNAPDLDALEAEAAESTDEEAEEAADESEAEVESEAVAEPVG